MRRLLCILLLSAAGMTDAVAAFTQPADSVSLFRTQREHASPVAALAAAA